jgi:hypothetical protein
VVDGLDHVPREERPERSFLTELPPPSILPAGVLFVLGSQRLELDGMPPAVRDGAGANGARVDVTPLLREAVHDWADQAGLPGDVDRTRLFQRSGGHPLSTRYEIAALQTASTAAEREAWLKKGPVYGGDVEVYYKRAWHDLGAQAEAQRALAYVALAETPLRPEHLDKVVGGPATDAAWSAAGHLLTRDTRGGWSIFHNSFRLFVRAQTGLRHGQ